MSAPSLVRMNTVSFPRKQVSKQHIVFVLASASIKMSRILEKKSPSTYDGLKPAAWKSWHPLPWRATFWLIKPPLFLRHWPCLFSCHWPCLFFCHWPCLLSCLWSCLCLCPFHDRGGEFLFFWLFPEGLSEISETCSRCTARSWWRRLSPRRLISAAFVAKTTRTGSCLPHLPQPQTRRHRGCLATVHAGPCRVWVREHTN